MEKNINYIPEGYNSVTPILTIRGADEALKFYQRAFGAKVIDKMDRPDGKLMHATIQIGNSRVMLGEECPPHEGHSEKCPRSPADLKGTTTNLYIYVPDADASYKQAIKAGGTEVMPLDDMFWGDRIGMFKDPFGFVWSVATHKENLTPEQMKERSERFVAQQR